MSFQSLVGGFVGSLAGTIYMLGSFVGFLWCIKIVFTNFGILGLIISIFVAPVALYIAPIYEGLSHGNWLPFLLVYGVAIVAIILSLFMSDE